MFSCKTDFLKSIFAKQSLKETKIKAVKVLKLPLLSHSPLRLTWTSLKQYIEHQSNIMLECNPIHNDSKQVSHLKIKPNCGRGMWEVSSGSESVRLLVRQAANSTPRQGSVLERSLVASRFSESLLLDALRTAMEQVRTWGFRRKPSSLKKAPRINPAKILEQFFGDPPFFFFWHLGDVVFSHSQNERFQWLALPRISLCMSRNRCYFSLVPECHHITGKRKSQFFHRLTKHFLFQSKKCLKKL